ncbi:hypothetical protein ACTI_70840 [Actinoplanes sp. OR16]|uniref:hypothetical protein n=1 Tax=Actinoplanes sp. OR16 TaxID=946334 RepID=UPI000F6CC974|nr:hypothetical protein [Actinoplanes sp. OR16]BBH70399.1 hypothetical protein ACTI_70840 [Actinoplanes sp. OR16]
MRRFSVLGPATAVLGVVLVGPAGPAVAATKSTITASVPAAMRTGATAAVTGRLSPGTKRTVRLERINGTRSYVLATARTGSDGKYTLSMRPATSGTWTVRVYAPASGSYRAVSSPKRAVRLWTATTATLAFTPAVATAGKALAITGRVTPGESGRTVTAQRWTGRSWTTAGRAASSAKGEYRIAVPAPGQAGTTSWRIVVAGTTYRGAYTSGVRALTTKAAPTTPPASPTVPPAPPATTAPPVIAPPTKPTAPTKPPATTSPTGPTPSASATSPSASPSATIPAEPTGPFIVAAADGTIHAVELNAPHRAAPLATGRYLASTQAGSLLYRGADFGLYLTTATLPVPRLLADGGECLMNEALGDRYAAWMVGRPMVLTGGITVCAASTDVRLFDTVTGTTTTLTMPRGVPGASSGTMRAAFSADGAHLVMTDVANAMYVYSPATARWTQPRRPALGPMTLAGTSAPGGYLAVDQQSAGCVSGRWLVEVAGTTAPTCVESGGVTGWSASPDGSRTLWTATAGGETHVIVGDAALTVVSDLGPVAAGTIPRFAGDGAVVWDAEIRPLDGSAAWRLPAGWAAHGAMN